MLNIRRRPCPEIVQRGKYKYEGNTYTIIGGLPYGVTLDMCEVEYHWLYFDKQSNTYWANETYRSKEEAKQAWEKAEDARLEREQADVRALEEDAALRAYKAQHPGSPPVEQDQEQAPPVAIEDGPHLIRAIILRMVGISGMGLSSNVLFDALLMNDPFYEHFEPEGTDDPANLLESSSAYDEKINSVLNDLIRDNVLSCFMNGSGDQFRLVPGLHFNALLASYSGRPRSSEWKQFTVYTQNDKGCLDWHIAFGYTNWHAAHKVASDICRDNHLTADDMDSHHIVLVTQAPHGSPAPLSNKDMVCMADLLDMPDPVISF